MNGRGAWPVSGSGGTYRYLSDQPGPYYFIGSGTDTSDVNGRAVHGAMKAYQRALGREVSGDVAVDGVLGEQTSAAIKIFQADLGDPHTYPVWGGIGPETSKALLMPGLRRVANHVEHAKSITWRTVCGVITQESTWDAGAVGYVDVRDIGLAQINGGAHPALSVDDRLAPSTSFKFVFEYLTNAVRVFKNLDAAIASYNLGIGGAQDWVSHGKPDQWTPGGQTEPRNVRAYIDRIKSVC